MATTIFGFEQPSSHAPKIHVSHSQLPTTYLDPTQPPTHKSPWRQVHANTFIRDLRIIVPTRHLLHLYQISSPLDLIENKLIPTHNYAKVIMSLSDILADDKLRRDEHIMLSVPQDPASASTTISLNRGVLVIDMPRHVYERSGLTFPSPAGEKIKSGARKHDRRSERRRIHANLREASMVKGKRGFDRLLWAAKNVDELKEARVWLFTQYETGGGLKHGIKRKRDQQEAKRTEGQSDLNSTLHDAIMRDSDSADAVGQVSTRTADTNGTRETNLSRTIDRPSSQQHPLTSHHPTLISCPPSISTRTGIQVPDTISQSEFLNSLHEHGGQQDRQDESTPVFLEDDIHEFSSSLSALFLPTTRSHPTSTLTTTNNANTGEDLTLLSWSGLIPSSLVINLLIDIITRSRSHSHSPELRYTSTPSNAHHNTNDPLWTAIQTVNHRLTTKGQCNGLTILLQSPNPSSSSSIEKDNPKIPEKSPEHRKDGNSSHEPAPIEPRQKSNSENSKSRRIRDEHGPETTVSRFEYVTCLEYFDAMTT